jgi:hypothetical protein
MSFRRFVGTNNGPDVTIQGNAIVGGNNAVAGNMTVGGNNTIGGNLIVGNRGNVQSTEVHTQLISPLNSSEPLIIQAGEKNLEVHGSINLVGSNPTPAIYVNGQIQSNGGGGVGPTGPTGSGSGGDSLWTSSGTGTGNIIYNNNWHDGKVIIGNSTSNSGATDSDFQVIGNSFLDGDTTITGNVILSGGDGENNLSVSGDLEVTGQTSLQRTYINNSLNVNSNITIDSSGIDIIGSATLHGGDITIGGTGTNVGTGNLNFNSIGKILINQNFGGIQVGDQQINLAQLKSFWQADPNNPTNGMITSKIVTINNKLNVNGDELINGNLDISGNLHTIGTTTLDGATTIDDTLTVTGITQLSNILTVGSSGTNKNTTLYGNVGIKTQASSSHALDISGSINILEGTGNYLYNGAPITTGGGSGDTFWASSGDGISYPKNVTVGTSSVNDVNTFYVDGTSRLNGNVGINTDPIDDYGLNVDGGLNVLNGDIHVPNGTIYVGGNPIDGINPWGPTKTADGIYYNNGGVAIGKDTITTGKTLDVSGNSQLAGTVNITDTLDVSGNTTISANLTTNKLLINKTSSSNLVMDISGGVRLNGGVSVGQFIGNTTGTESIYLDPSSGNIYLPSGSTVYSGNSDIGAGGGGSSSGWIDDGNGIVYPDNNKVAIGKDSVDISYELDVFGNVQINGGLDITGTVRINGKTFTQNPFIFSKGRHVPTMCSPGKYAFSTVSYPLTNLLYVSKDYCANTDQMAVYRVEYGKSIPNAIVTISPVITRSNSNIVGDNKPTLFFNMPLATSQNINISSLYTQNTVSSDYRTVVYTTPRNANTPSSSFNHGVDNITTTFYINGVHIDLYYNLLDITIIAPDDRFKPQNTNGNYNGCSFWATINPSNNAGITTDYSRITRNGYSSNPEPILCGIIYGNLLDANVQWTQNNTGDIVISSNNNQISTQPNAFNISCINTGFENDTLQPYIISQDEYGFNYAIKNSYNRPLLPCIPTHITSSTDDSIGPFYINWTAIGTSS